MSLIILVYIVYYILSVIPIRYARRFYKYTYQDYAKDKLLDEKREKTRTGIIFCAVIQGIIVLMKNDILAISRNYIFLILSALIFLIIYAYIIALKLYSPSEFQ